MWIRGTCARGSNAGETTALVIKTTNRCCRPSEGQLMRMYRNHQAESMKTHGKNFCEKLVGEGKSTIEV